MIKRLAWLCTILAICTFPTFAQTQHDRIKSRGASTFDQFSNTQTLVISGATPSIAGGNVFRTSNSGATTITNFLGGVDSQQITIVCGDANTIIQNNANIFVTGGANFSCSLNASLTFVFTASANIWSETGGTGAGGGGSPGAPAQAFQCNGGSSNFVACNMTDDTVNINVNENAKFKGPNPYVDATLYGVRAVNPNVAPAINGVNCTTTGGSPTVILSAASTFKNGDGVVCQNAGAANGLGAASTPTVTPSNPSAPTGTGQGVAAPNGATTYNYCVFATDVGGGSTACGSTGSTTTGNASLGSQSQAGYSATRSNDTWTFTVGSTPPFSAGAMVTIDTPTSGTADADFEGTYKVSTVTGTGFTVANAPLDTRNGARAASLGTYTVHYYNYNKVTWSAVTGSPFRYFVCSDRASPGTFHVLGPALLPVNPKHAFTDGTLEFDDYGATMMGQSVNGDPWYISDANCTGAATNDNWVTTISSGAGTTTLTMSGNAPSSNGGPLTIRFDNTPNMLAAIAAANAANAPVVLPLDQAGNAYVFNSVNDWTTNPTLYTPQGLLTFDSILYGENAGKWYGDRGFSSKGVIGQFASQSNPVITTKATPGVLITDGFSTTITGLSIAGPNNTIPFIQDGGGGALGSTYIDDNFQTGAQSTDYMGMAFVCRGVSGADCRASFKGKNLLISGTQSMANSSSTPSLYCDGCATFQADEIMGSSRAMLFYGATNGGAGSITFRYIDWQGGSTPLITLGAKYGTSGISVAIGGSTMDTMAQPCLANLNGTSAAASIVGCVPSSVIPQISGTRMAGGITGGLSTFSFSGTTQAGQNRDTSVLASGLTYDGIYGSGVAASNTIQQLNSGLQVDQTHQVFIAGAAPVITSCPVSAGGSVSIATHNFTIVPVWWDGGEGVYSASCQAITSTGNQTVTLNWNAVPGNPKNIRVYMDAGRLNNVIAGGATSLVLSSATGTGQVAVNIPSSGPTVLMPGVQGIAAPTYILGNSGFSSSESAGTLTANRAVIRPDVAGFEIVTPELFTNSPRGPLHALFPGALTTTWTGETFTLDKGITVTRVQAQLRTAPSGCGTNAIVRLSDGTSNVNLTLSAAANDSGAVSQSYAAGAVLTLAVQTAAATCTTSPGDANVVVEYRMN